MNPYLKMKRGQYDQLRSSIETLQKTAAEHKNADGSEGRNLTEDELTLVRSQGEEAKKVAAEIESLTEIETRSAKVHELGRSLAGQQDKQSGQGGEFRSLGSSSTTAQDRDPGHYRSVKDGGQHSFFGDLYRSSAFKDETAGTRLTEHTRALSTGAQGVGVVPPKWLTDEFETLARQGRALANAVRNIPLGDDPRPLTLPKQTAGTDAAINEQANENDPLTDSDDWDSDVDTVVPKPTTGKQTVSRQMVDMTTPAIDLLIYGDLMEVYNLKVENKVGTAVLAAGPAPIAATAALFSDMATDGTNGSDLAVRAAIAVRKSRKLPANILAMTIDRYGEYLQLKDSTGRPLMPEETAGPMNVIGVGSVQVDGRIRGMGVVATDAMGTGALPDQFAALRASDTLLFESNMLRFRFEEVQGPESVVLGIWGYTAVIVRQGGKGVQRVQITAA